jgi:hypothetical protein
MESNGRRREGDGAAFVRSVSPAGTDNVEESFQNAIQTLAGRGGESVREDRRVLCYLGLSDVMPKRDDCLISDNLFGEQPIELSLWPPLREEMRAKDHDPEPRIGQASVDALAKRIAQFQ